MDVWQGRSGVWCVSCVQTSTQASMWVPGNSICPEQQAAIHQNTHRSREHGTPLPLLYRFRGGYQPPHGTVPATSDRCVGVRGR
jgi:hypothetical protein